MKFREYFGTTTEVYDLDMNIETVNVRQMAFMMKQNDCEKKEKKSNTIFKFSPVKNDGCMVFLYENNHLKNHYFNDLSN